MPALARAEATVEGEPQAGILERLPDPSACVLESIWEEEWNRNLADAALERVKQKANPKHYQLFDLFVRKNWSVGEITRTMEVTEHQVYTAKSRISALLQKEVRRLESAII